MPRQGMLTILAIGLANVCIIKADYYLCGNYVGDMLTNIDLRAARRAAKLTQDEAGKLINVKRDTILSYEKGNSKPSIKVIEQLLNAYGFNILVLSADEMRIFEGNKPYLANFGAKQGEIR